MINFPVVESIMAIALLVAEAGPTTSPAAADPSEIAVFSWAKVKLPNSAALPTLVT